MNGETGEQICQKANLLFLSFVMKDPVKCTSDVFGRITKIVLYLRKYFC